MFSPESKKQAGRKYAGPLFFKTGCKFPVPILWLISVKEGNPTEGRFAEVVNTYVLTCPFVYLLMTGIVDP